ncbi:MAG: hypothetical protein H0V77_12805 [Actinobacteria bacterium]|nr:hypothetical protein [Actinomycetota bacterium]
MAEKSDLNRRPLASGCGKPGGRADGAPVRTDERQRLSDLECDVKELRRTTTSIRWAFFAEGLDLRPPR